MPSTVSETLGQCVKRCTAIVASSDSKDLVLTKLQTFAQRTLTRRLSRPNLDTLPLAPLQRICSFLPIWSIISLSQIDRDLRDRLLHCPQVWRHVVQPELHALWMRRLGGITILDDVYSNLIRRSQPLPLELELFVTHGSLRSSLAAVNEALSRASSLRVHTSNLSNLENWKMVQTLSFPAPLLRTLAITCIRVQSFEPVSASMARQLLVDWTAPLAGDAPHLSRCTLHGVLVPPSRWGMLRGLTYLDYDVRVELQVQDVRTMLSLLPQLQTLRLACIAILDRSQDFSHCLPQLTTNLKRLYLQLTYDDVPLQDALPLASVQQLTIFGPFFESLTSVYRFTGACLMYELASFRASLLPVHGKSDELVAISAYLFLGPDPWKFPFHNDPEVYKSLTWLALTEDMWPEDYEPPRAPALKVLAVRLSTCDLDSRSRLFHVSGIFGRFPERSWHLPALREFCTAPPPAALCTDKQCPMCHVPSVSLLDTCRFVQRAVRWDADLLDCITFAGTRLLGHDFTDGWTLLSRISKSLHIEEKPSAQYACWIPVNFTRELLLDLDYHFSADSQTPIPTSNM
ncbi:hypothetical protein EXIGLDRAFT_780150 [Exidia glandulosa HHB12029]|uniref:F-box domain-containing protein n=1 Tax=Exidia glandulosa HHB12029 TaxID=1314781 RepID=A0A165ZB34_EXIGL|nr:hypothetical protein EXIGLDRAFT_780150 [Exidia glandulosa HHB12029]